jgi:hypothetical protein
MAKISKATTDKALREKAFGFLFSTGNSEQDAQLAYYFHKINDRQYGIILTDMNGVKRYVRIGAIVAELREDMTAEELMQSEIDAYNQKQADKAEKAIKKEAKIAKDKAKREAKANEVSES